MPERTVQQQLTFRTICIYNIYKALSLWQTETNTMSVPYFPVRAEKLQRAKTSKKESCPFCQEQKKRPLIAYMRKRAQEKNGKICEEEPDEEEEAQAHAQHQQQQHRQHCHGDHHQQHSAAGNSSTCGKENAKTRK